MREKIDYLSTVKIVNIFIQKKTKKKKTKKQNKFDKLSKFSKKLEKTSISKLANFLVEFLVPTKELKRQPSSITEELISPFSINLIPLVMIKNVTFIY